MYILLIKKLDGHMNNTRLLAGVSLFSGAISYVSILKVFI